MGLGVRKIETSAERMAKLVMKRHANSAQAIATGPRTEQSVRARIPVIRLCDDSGKRTPDSRDGLGCECRGDWICVLRIQGFYRMRDSIDARHDRKARRQGHREFDVVNDRLGKHLR